MPSLRRPVLVVTAITLTAITLTALALAACGSTDALPEESSAKAETVTVSSQFGKVKVPAEPKRALSCTPRTSTS